MATILMQQRIEWTKRLSMQRCWSFESVNASNDNEIALIQKTDNSTFSRWTGRKEISASQNINRKFLFCSRNHKLQTSAQSFPDSTFSANENVKQHRSYPIEFFSVITVQTQTPFSSLLFPRWEWCLSCGGQIHCCSWYQTQRTGSHFCLQLMFPRRRHYTVRQMHA